MRQMIWMVDLSRENDKCHPSHLIVELQGWFHFDARRVASHLYDVVVRSGPPVDDRMSRVKEA